MFFTEVAQQQVLVMEKKVKALLEKGAIEYVSHSKRELLLYRQYFIVPKKDGVLRPILDFRVLNNSVMPFKFKMLSLRQIVPQFTVHSGSPSCIQLLSDWTQWCRHDRGFVCMHFPRLLCSRKSWREFVWTGFCYFSLRRSGRVEYGSQI